MSSALKGVSIDDGFLAENCGMIVDGVASDASQIWYWMSPSIHRINQSICSLLLFVSKTEYHHACVKCSGKTRAGTNKIHLGSWCDQKVLTGCSVAK